MARSGTSELAPGTNALLGEALMLCHDRPTGLSAAIAVDDTTLGPGLGGVRWMPYTSFSAAVEEACRLSQGMTLKNALADIPYGGAKSVILRREGDGGDPAWREAQLRAFARFVSRLGGCLHPRGRHGNVGGRSRRHRHRGSVGELQPRGPLAGDRLSGCSMRSPQPSAMCWAATCRVCG